MTAIVMGDVNAAYTLECAHRRHLLAARALSGRSLPITGLPFPRTKTIGDVCIDDLVILSVLQQFSDVHVDSSPPRYSAPMLCTISWNCRRMRVSQAVHSRGSFWEVTSTTLQASSGSLLNAEYRSC